MPQSEPPAQATAWIEVVILAPAPQAEAAADFLVTLTGLGVEVDDFASPPAPVRVRGFLPASVDLAAQKALLSRYADELGEQAGQDVLVSFFDLAS